MKKTLLLLFLLVPLSTSLFCQSFQIMRYGMSDGLIHEGTYSIVQDQDGFIWVSTAQGLCRFDGQGFSNEFIGDTLPSSISAVSYVDSKGRVWFGYDDGMISIFANNSFSVLEPDEDHLSMIVGISEDQEGKTLVMTQQKGLIRIDKDMKLEYLDAPFNNMFVSQFHVMDNRGLLIGGFDGITLFNYSQDSMTYVKSERFDDIPYTEVKTIVRGFDKDEYWIGTEDEGVFLIKGSGTSVSDFEIEQIGVDQGLGYSSVSSIMVDPQGYVWISDYGVGVYRFAYSSGGKLSSPLLFNEKGGMPEEYIKAVFQDDEGNVWFSSQSNGIAVLRDQAFTFYNFESDVDIPEITAISMDEDNYWFGSSKGKLYWMKAVSEGFQNYFSPADGLPNDVVTALWHDKKGDVFVGFAASGIYTYNKASQSFRSYFKTDNSMGNAVNALTGDEEALWVATNNGVYKIDRLTKLVENYTTRQGLPHNTIHDVYMDRHGRVWLATTFSGLFCVTDDIQRTIHGNPKLEFNSIAEDADGNLWAGTREGGVFKFDSDTIAYYSVDDGLKSKYTYAVDIDSQGSVWVGHRQGLSRIDPQTGNIAVFGPEMGFTSDILQNAISSDAHGLVLFGTNNGLITYDAKQARTDTIPPRLSITRLSISDSIYDPTIDIKLKYGIYKINIDFVGINLSNPDQVLYRYKMEGFDDWSEPSFDTHAKYSRIEDGEYVFMVMACDGNGNCTEKPLELRISVKIPIWKAWWFILSLALLAIVIVFLIIKIRERKQKALNEFLEQQLNERTAEVVHQKEEIEIKNRDITDSINYAQRIQASILPPIQRLDQTFSGSFVFYQPRDIVSGDFYWYDKLDDDRFLIVCADSTGHGVPGAFMSMIGTTLIKDICLRADVHTPSDVLQTLDKEIREALNQNAETDGSNDGMDIIVAEINLKTNKFMVSSAMRPVILYKDGEQIYVKGSRSSVGGQLDESATYKEFANEEFQLNRGDIVYMFSDGYPDQFGGPLGRKFKMVRLKNLLRDIQDKPMDEQYNYVKSNFFLWKEDLEQVDDVLFMGIKI